MLTIHLVRSIERVNFTAIAVNITKKLSSNIFNVQIVEYFVHVLFPVQCDSLPFATYSSLLFLRKQTVRKTGRKIAYFLCSSLFLLPSLFSVFIIISLILRILFSSFYVIVPLLILLSSHLLTLLAPPAPKETACKAEGTVTEIFFTMCLFFPISYICCYNDHMSTFFLF